MSVLKLYRTTSYFSTECSRSTRAYFVCANRRRERRNMSTTVSSKVLKSPYSDVHVSYKSLTEMVWKDLHKWSNKVAIQSAETGQKYTYGNLRKLCARFARALKKRKFRKGQVLSIVMPNVPQYLIVLLGAIEAGLVVTALNPSFTPTELSHQIEDSGTVIVVTLTTLADRLKSAIEIIENKNTKRECPISIVTLEENAESASSFGEMLNDGDDDSFESYVEVAPEDVVLLPYSSGTTGFPKGVQLTHSNLLYNLTQLSGEPIRSVQETNDDFQEIVPAVLPFFHIFGTSALILISLINGCKIISLKKFDLQKYLHLITHEKASVLYLVPTLASFLTSHPSMKANDLQNIRVAFCAGGNTPVNEMEKLIALSGNKMKIRHAYGLTETSPAVSVSRDTDPLNTIGQPLSNTRIKIVGENGTLKGSYQRGEICVQGPQVMKGYLNNPKATAEVIDADGYFHTGDVGYYNDEGNLFYVDRIKELIKVKGFQVAPVELESIIKAHNNVKDVGVIGVPDERCGEKPVAFVVPVVVENATSAKRSREEDLKRYVAEHVAPYKQLASVIFVDAIPRNPSGKILRRVLRENYANSC